MTAFVPESPDNAPPAAGPAGALDAASDATRRNALGDYFAVDDRRRPHRYHRLFVGYTKIFLLTLSGLLIGVLAIWPTIMNKDKISRVGYSSDVRPDDVASLRITNARLKGINEEGKPFTVTFELASQTETDSDLVLLTRPRADAELDSGAWVVLSADKGRFHRANRTIELDDPVRLFHDSGLEIGTGNVTFNLATGTGAGHDPLTAQAPFGQFESQGFRIRENGTVFHFTGPIRAILYSAPDQGG